MSRDLAGTDGREPLDTRKRPDMPKAAMDEWDQLLALDDVHWLEASRQLLVTYCALVSQMAVAQEGLAVDGPTQRTKSGLLIPTPWPNTLRQTAMVLKAYAMELGITPTRLKALPPKLRITSPPVGARPRG